MKSKMLLLLLLAALAMSCAESFVSVPIPFMEKRAADFSASQDVFFIDFICDVPEAGFNAEAEIRRTFAEEIPRAILQRYRLNIDIQYEDSVFFRNVFKAHPRSLFFTGKLKLDIKRMGVVKETRDEMGNRKNAYETVQLWEMEMKVFLIDGDTAKILRQETYKEKLEPGPETTAQFNFNSLFARMTAKLTVALQPRKVLQQRFILDK
jgi:hypothetical protein